MKLTKWITAAFLATTLAACSGHSQKEEEASIKTYAEAEKEFTESLSHEDSIQVIGLSERCMHLLKCDSTDAALAMLYSVHQGSMKPLEGDELAMQKSRFKRFPVKEYELEKFAFSTQGLNDVKYRVEFAPKDANGYAPTISIMFNPVKLDGQWYLCLKSPEQPGKDMENPLHENAPAPDDVNMAPAR
jgi:hypothetical protein